jgi:cyanate lyase
VDLFELLESEIDLESFLCLRKVYSEDPFIYRLYQVMTDSYS